MVFRFGPGLALLCAACSSTAPGPPGAAGTAVVRVTTDAHEKIVDVTILQSSGSRALDRYAAADTRNYWHGAAGSVEEVAVRYTPGTDGRPAPTFRLKPR